MYTQLVNIIFELENIVRKVRNMLKTAINPKTKS